MTLIALESGGGKSLIKRHLMQAAGEAGFESLVLDAEDPPGKTADRTLANSTGLNSRDIGHLRFDDIAEAQIEAALVESAWASKVTHVSGGLTADEVRKALSTNRGARLVLFDYLQAVPEENGRSYERTLSALAWDLQKDAEENQRAVVVFGQVGPDVEERGDGRAEWSRRAGRGEVDVSGYRPGPGIKDLGWCKDAGRRAKEVVYAWRPGRWKKKHGVSGAKDDHFEFIKEKVNFGVEGRFLVRVDLPTARLSDWDT